MLAPNELSAGLLAKQNCASKSQMSQTHNSGKTVKPAARGHVTLPPLLLAVAVAVLGVRPAYAK